MELMVELEYSMMFLVWHCWTKNLELAIAAKSLAPAQLVTGGINRSVRSGCCAHCSPLLSAALTRKPPTKAPCLPSHHQTRNQSPKSLPHSHHWPPPGIGASPVAFYFIFLPTHTRLLTGPRRKQCEVKPPIPIVLHHLQPRLSRSCHNHRP